jgi:hypothetical protein
MEHSLTGLVRGGLIAAALSLTVSACTKSVSMAGIWDATVEVAGVSVLFRFEIADHDGSLGRVVLRWRSEGALDRRTRRAVRWFSPSRSSPRDSKRRSSRTAASPGNTTAVPVRRPIPFMPGDTRQAPNLVMQPRRYLVSGRFQPRARRASRPGDSSSANRTMVRCRGPSCESMATPAPSRGGMQTASS